MTKDYDPRTDYSPIVCGSVVYRDLAQEDRDRVIYEESLSNRDKLQIEKLQRQHNVLYYDVELTEEELEELVQEYDQDNDLRKLIGNKT